LPIAWTTILWLILAGGLAGFVGISLYHYFNVGQTFVSGLQQVAPALGAMVGSIGILMTMMPIMFIMMMFMNMFSMFTGMFGE
jgi:hypothetical protein